MPKEIIFEELKRDEKILLLRAFDYDVDSEGYIITFSGSRIESKEFPTKFIHIDEASFIPGSLEIIDGTPTAIAKFIRERVDKSDGSID